MLHVVGAESTRRALVWGKVWEEAEARLLGALPFLFAVKAKYIAGKFNFYSYLLL